MSETAVSKKISDGIPVAFPGALVIRVHSGMLKVGGGWLHCAPAGTPDKLVLLPHGRSVWLEVKDPDGRKTDRDRAARQLEWRQKAARLGHLAFEVSSLAEALDACREALR
jgi:hypothetical protein